MLKYPILIRHLIQIDFHSCKVNRQTGKQEMSLSAALTAFLQNIFKIRSLAQVLCAYLSLPALFIKSQK